MTGFHCQILRTRTRALYACHVHLPLKKVHHYISCWLISVNIDRVAGLLGRKQMCVNVNNQKNFYRAHRAVNQNGTK